MDQVINTYKQILIIHQARNELSNEADIWRNLGNVYLIFKQIKPALEAYQHALSFEAQYCSSDVDYGTYTIISNS